MSTTSGVQVLSEVCETPDPCPGSPSATPLDASLTEKSASFSAPPKKENGLSGQVVEQPTKVLSGGKGSLGFAAHPDHIWRRNRPRKARTRIIPKPQGWRPFHENSLLSALDVATIRASKRGHRVLGELYGVSASTIRDIRKLRRGAGAKPPSACLDRGQILAALGLQINDALKLAEKRLALARQRERIRRELSNIGGER